MGVSPRLADDQAKHGGYGSHVPLGHARWAPCAARRERPEHSVPAAKRSDAGTKFAEVSGGRSRPFRKRIRMLPEIASKWRHKLRLWRRWALRAKGMALSKTAAGAKRRRLEKKYPGPPREKARCSRDNGKRRRQQAESRIKVAGVVGDHNERSRAEGFHGRRFGTGDRNFEIGPQRHGGHLKRATAAQACPADATSGTGRAAPWPAPGQGRF